MTIGVALSRGGQGRRLPGKWTIMTKAEYASYQTRVASGNAGLEHLSTGACSGCGECGLSDCPTESERGLAEESHFSGRACDLCGCELGGDRYPAHAFVNNVLVHLDVCSYCLYFVNYGQLDDATMQDMQETTD